MAIGRRTDLTPQLQERICKLISDNGMYPAQAAISCGISETTFYEWMARGRVNSSSSSSIEPGSHGRGDALGLYANFAAAIKKADAKLELNLVTDALGKARKSKNPLAPVILLSRRFRERWAEQIQVTSGGKDAVASMERIKEAWDAPEIVEGEYREVLDEGTIPKLEAGKVVSVASQKCPLTNLATDIETPLYAETGNPASSFHALPTNYTDPEYTENENIDQAGIKPCATLPTPGLDQLRRLINERREAIENTDTNIDQPPNNIDRPAADARQSAEDERQLEEGLPTLSTKTPTKATPVEISKVKSSKE